jgi:oligopeptide transport system substrate-binding protein
MHPRRVALAAAVAVSLAVACGNNPYSDADNQKKILYLPFSEAPKSLDPAVAYDTPSHAITANVFDTLLDYHYLERPYRLIPNIAREVPHAEPLADGTLRYRFELREDLWFHPDPCFALGPGKPKTRLITAADVAFELQRIGDPEVNSPAIEPFSNILGFAAFNQRLRAAMKQDPSFKRLRKDQQYARAGGVEGIRVPDAGHLEIRLDKAYPQILYWFAMPFTTPLPWEAVAYYDGRDGRPHLADHPVGSGPFALTRYEKQGRMVLERNENWYGLRHPEWKAPAATYPEQGEPADAKEGHLAASAVGHALPWLERVEFRREKESIPTFNKMLQGYYDTTGVIRESFDKVVKDDQLSPDMAKLGFRLDKSVVASVWYFGFNMLDPVVGGPGGERSRKLRQAMSLSVDVEEFLRIFRNGRGVPAQSPIPPGIFGYEAEYKNPYRVVDLERARKLLAEGGYPGGIDPSTGRPLHLSFDTGDTSANGRLQYQFWVNQWRRIGLDVEISQTTFNKFQEKVQNGAFQLLFWGWLADYPDAENFLFLLWSEMGRTKNNGPNSANFSNPEFDRLFLEVKAREDDSRKLELIRSMRKILEQQRPWIELFHEEDYKLVQGWLKNVKASGLSSPAVKYYDLDAEERARKRRAWNRPLLWPLLALALAVVALVVPGVRTYLKERR